MEKLSAVYDISVYEVAPNKQEALLWVDILNRQMSSLPGFVSRIVHQSLSEPHIWMDYTMWESAQHAAKARRKFMHEPFRSFFADNLQKLILRKQFAPFNSCGNTPKLPLEKNIELAVYRIQHRNMDQYELLFDKMKAVFEQHPGFLHRQCGIATLEAHWFMDYIYWEKEADTSLDSLRVHPEIQAFYNLIYDVPFFHHFRIVPEEMSHSLGLFV